MIKGVLFDFNGTLFWDTQYHIDSWTKYAKDHFGKELTNEDFLTNIHGRSNRYIVPYLTEGKITDENEIFFHVNEKCKVYQNLVKLDLANLNLIDGLVELFEFLKENDIKFTICTASREANVKFYYEIFPILKKYIPYEDVIFDDNTIVNGKPHPEFYFKGAAKIGVDIKDCIVLEDSYSGLMSGLNSKCYQTVGVDNGLNKEELESLNIKVVVKNFFELIDYIKKENKL